MEKNQKSESYIIREAENVIEEYLKQQKDQSIEKIKEKYERLKILSVAMAVVGSIGILINIITS